MELKVKKTIAEELRYLEKLENDSFEVNAKYFENGVIPPLPEEDEEKYSFKVLSKQKDTETFTIYYKNEIVGGVIVKDIEPKTKEVLLFFIAPEMQCSILTNVEVIKMIETKRLILRPFVEKDAKDVFEYLKEPMVNCFACMKLNTIEDAKIEVERRAKENEFYFAIVLKETGKVIGEIEAYPETHLPEAVNEVYDTFSPCWMLNKEYHGKGYAYEAAYAFFEYLFFQKGARRIYAYTEDYNLSCQHLCEKLGMRREGTFVEFVSFINDVEGNPIYENTIQYAILKKEWKRSDNSIFKTFAI